MSRSIILLRGINLGATRKVPMPELRALLTDAGFEDVATYVQSGNVALSTPLKPAPLADETSRLIAERFGFDVPVIVRTRADLNRIVKLNPLGEVADNPKRYQVSFLSDKLDGATAARLEEVRADPEALAVHGREIYAWHPEGVARSKLWNTLGGKGLGVTATARNWTTVLALHELAAG